MKADQFIQQPKNPLAELTYVVLTYHRQSYALRFMNYWNERGPRVVVIDGTDSPIPKGDLVPLGAAITYIHNPAGIYARLREALDHIKTRYVALAGDDEFYIPSAVTTCLRELDRDPSLVACCGRALGFSPDRNYAVSGFQQYPGLRNYSLDDNHPKARLLKHLCAYVPSLIYSISRTDEWKTAWKHILIEEFPAHSITELQFEICMSVAGKSRVLSELMWLRSHDETVPVRGTDASNDPEKSFRTWWISPTTAGDRGRFVNLMSGAFADLLGRKGDRREWVVRAIEMYLYQSPMRRVKNLVKKLLPYSFQEKVRKFSISLCSGFNRRGSQLDSSLISAAGSLVNEGVIVDFEELHNIEKIITSFHRERHIIAGSRLNER